MFRKTIHSREVTRIVDYSIMPSNDRILFFKAYDYKPKTEIYYLVDEESAKKTSHNRNILEAKK